MKRLVLLFCLLTSPLVIRAEFIQPVAVLASNGDGTSGSLIDGGGFEADPGLGTPDSVHNQSSGEMWSAVGSIRESVVFDLGKTVNLTNIYIWNYNVPNQTDVGMKDVEVQVSSSTNMTNATFTSIATITLKEGGDKAQSFAVVGTDVRLVKLKGLSNWGQGYTVGLAEVRFDSGDVSGFVPSIVLNSPHDGDEIAFGVDITVDARITDRDGAGNLQKVELFDGDTLVTNKPVATFTAVIKGAAKGDHAIRLIATDKTGKVGWVTANIFVRELVADRILKIDDTADQGTDINQINYTGAWNLAQGNDSDPRYNHNDHYESNNNKNDYFEVRFIGVKIDIFSTVASHHGTGLASIDGGPESKAIYKAAQRAEQVFIWSSPILPNGEHVLKVRVAGDGVVTADRFDVSVSDKPIVTTPTIKEVTATTTSLTVKVEDAATSLVDPSTVSLFLDNAKLQSSVTRVPPITTISHVPTSPFLPGSTHEIRVEAKDTKGISVTNQATFTLPAPDFPLTGMGEPSSTAGNWALREIWNGGRADALVSAVTIALQANQPGFIGKIQDDKVSVINFTKSSNPGPGGYIPDDQPLPAEANGLSDSDFVIVARAKVKIPRTGDWTIGVHTDEGFALRFIGAPFASVSGTGEIDPDFPEFIRQPNNTADSNTRGVLQNIAAGTYEIEFISWERVGSASYEIYAAEGAFAEDADTDQWQLIGAPGGLEIIEAASAGENLNIIAINKQGNSVTLDFTSPNPDGTHQLQQSTDLKSWQPVAGATFQKNQNAVRASVTGATGATAFYRVTLP